MKNKKPKIKIRIPQSIYDHMMKELRKPHVYAHERVGFLTSGSKMLASGVLIITITGFHSVCDDDYIKDDSVGARINSAAIRKAMQLILDREEGCFHVHLHDHFGMPSPGTTDKKGIPGIVNSFANVSSQPHGFIIFSKDSFYVTVKIAGITQLITPQIISVIGYPMKFVLPGKTSEKPINLYDRQSFLGPLSQFFFQHIKIGIIGYGGGGSHFGQQLAHLGCKQIVVFDDDIIEDTNHNRLVGAWHSDIHKNTPKATIAKRSIRKIFPGANINIKKYIWQNQPDELLDCDIVLTAVDTYIGRHDLEAACRRYLIPMIDIGMDVYLHKKDPPHMSGQVILSMPGMPCMHCFGFLNNEKLKIEAAKYGDTGGRPQVIWPNGTLASSAIGILVDLLTGWTKQTDRIVYLSYNGNTQLISKHIRVEFAGSTCCHYPLDQTGPPKFKRI